MLFEQHDENYIIDLIESNKSSFILLYNLSQNELAKFQYYFDNVLAKE